MTQSDDTRPVRQPIQIRPGETYQRLNGKVVRVDTLPDALGQVGVCEPGDKEGLIANSVALSSLRNPTPMEVRVARIADGKYVASQWLRVLLRGGVALYLREVAIGADEFVFELTSPQTIPLNKGVFFKGAGTRDGYVSGRTEQHYSFGLRINGLPVDPNYKHEKYDVRFVLSRGITLFMREYEPGQWSGDLSHPTIDLRKASVSLTEVSPPMLIARKGQQVSQTTSMAEYDSRYTFTMKVNLPAVEASAEQSAEK